MDSSQSIMWLIIVCLAFIVFIVFSKPIKYLLMAIMQGIFGVLGIYIFNFLIAPLGISVGLNFLTFSVTGILGIPGFVLLYTLSMIL